MIEEGFFLATDETQIKHRLKKDTTIRIPFRSPSVFNLFHPWLYIHIRFSALSTARMEASSMLVSTPEPQRVLPVASLI